MKSRKRGKLISGLMLAVSLALLCGQLPFVWAEGVKEPGAVYDFTDEFILDPGEGVFESAMNLLYDLDEGYLHIVSMNGPGDGGVGDPYMILKLDALDADEYPYMKIKLRNHTDITKFQLHFDPAGIGITAAANTLFDISANDEEFKTYVVNLKEANEATFPISAAYSDIGDPEESLWTGEIDHFRLDFLFVDFPGGQVPTDSEMDIEYVAFFDSEESANAFTNEKVVTPTPEATPTPDVTEAPTAAPTEEPTAAPTSAPTAAPTEAPEEKGGCGSVLSGGAAMLATVLVSFFFLKKKRNG